MVQEAGARKGVPGRSWGLLSQESAGKGAVIPNPAGSWALLEGREGSVQGNLPWAGFRTGTAQRKSEYCSNELSESPPPPCLEQEVENWKCLDSEEGLCECLKVAGSSRVPWIMGDNEIKNLAS